MKFSDQATATLLMTLQKCLMEEKDIVDLLKEWNLTEEGGELYVTNPPVIQVSSNEENTEPSNKFEVPDDL
jgi:hypothetical protein